MNFSVRVARNGYILDANNEDYTRKYTEVYKTKAQVFKAIKAAINNDTPFPINPVQDEEVPA